MSNMIDVPTVPPAPIDPENPVRGLGEWLNFLGYMVMAYMGAREGVSVIVFQESNAASADNRRYDGTATRQKATERISLVNTFADSISFSIAVVRPYISGIHTHLGALGKDPSVWETETSLLIQRMQQRIAVDSMLLDFGSGGFNNPNGFIKDSDTLKDDLSALLKELAPKVNDLACVALPDNEPIDSTLNKPVVPDNSEQQFLSKDMGAVSLKHATANIALLSILESRFTEAIQCLRHDAPLAAIILCGSVLEGLLLDKANDNPKQFNEAANSPKDKAGQVKQFQYWKLAELIDVAYEIDWLTLDVKKFSHAMRDFRNYVHPYQQMNSHFNPGKHTGDICLQVLKAAIACLSKKKDG